MKATFQIEQILTIKNKVYILVKHIDPDKNFTLSNTSTLNGVAIENWVDIPRAYDTAGNLRSSYYTFVLREAKDKNRINVGDIVELNSSV